MILQDTQSDIIRCNFFHFIHVRFSINILCYLLLLINTIFYELIRDAIYSFQTKKYYFNSISLPLLLFFIIRTRLIWACYIQIDPNLVRLLTTVMLGSLRTVLVFPQLIVCYQFKKCPHYVQRNEYYNSLSDKTNKWHEIPLHSKLLYIFPIS